VCQPLQEQKSQPVDAQRVLEPAVYGPGIDKGYETKLADLRQAAGTAAYRSAAARAG
jgi:hypothetical protein